MVHINWKKTFLVVFDVILAAYIIVAFMAFNKPNEVSHVCTQVNINIQDEATNGFITAQEIKTRLEKNKLYPLNKPLKDINVRGIEEMLKLSSFVKTAECYKTTDGHVNITLTQRMPTVRIKAINGDDYYLDDNNIRSGAAFIRDLMAAVGVFGKPSLEEAEKVIKMIQEAQHN